MTHAPDTNSRNLTSADPLNRAEKMRLMGEMASGVVHDFNNILGAIIGRVQLALTKDNLAEIKQSLAQVEKIALQGGETVKRLQSFTRQEGQRDRRPVDLNRVIADALEVTRHRWEAQGQREGIVYVVEQHLAPQCVAPGVQSELIDVVANLVFNALDAMPSGGRLTLSSSVTNGRCRLEVADTGEGMAPDQIEQVFYPFYSTKGAGGSGLGLAVAFSVITRHDGNISVDSELGRGTTMIIDLPATEEAHADEEVAAPVTDSGERNILLVDDDHTILDVMGEALREVGHRVTTFDNGSEAILSLGDQSYDLVITDLGMPGITGWEVARQAKSQSPPLPVIVISGWGAQLEHEDCRVDAVLAKPFHLDQLRQTIMKVSPGQAESVQLP